MTFYIWLKAIHLIFMVSWMAAMLIYPRYKLHQLKSAPGEPLFETMKEASVRLRKIIMTPSLIIIWLAGLGMILINWQGLSVQGWLHAKLVLLLALSGLHGSFVSMGRKIDGGETYSEKRLKLLNELPFVLAIVIILLAVLRPF